MKQDYKITFWRFILFAFIGLLLEVTLGAIVNLFHGNVNLRGSTSLWMMFDYGLLGVLLIPIKETLIKFRQPLFIRAFVYMLGIYAVEYISGTIFTAAGLHIWNYSGMRYNLHGHIALIYAPLWYLLGLAAELLFNKINSCAKVLAE